MIHNMSLLSFSNADELTQRVCRVVDRTFGVGKNADEVGFWMSVSLAFPEPECLKLLVQALEKEFKHPFPHVQKEGGRYTQLRSLLPLIRRDIQEQTKKEPNMAENRKTQEDIFHIVTDVLKEYDFRDRRKKLEPYDRLFEELNCDSLDIVQIGLTLEEKFNVDLMPMIEQEHPQYVTDLVAIVCRRFEIPYKTPPRPVAKKTKGVLGIYKGNPGRA